MRMFSFGFSLFLVSCASHNGAIESAPIEEASPAIRAAAHHDVGSATHAHDTSDESADASLPGVAVVIPHADLKAYGNNGNSLVGLATRSHGAQSFEIWRSSVAPGGSTPLHTHETEEVFIVLRGKGEMQVGDEIIEFEAPATVIAPAGIAHQLRNTGDVPTDQIVVVGIDSEIHGPDGKLMQLPWRQ